MAEQLAESTFKPHNPCDGLRDIGLGNDVAAYLAELPGTLVCPPRAGPRWMEPGGA